MTEPLDPARVLRPERPRLALARAVAAGYDDAVAAWEALAASGVIPLAWVGDPGRLFACLDCGGIGTIDDETFHAPAAHPWSVETAVAFAADPAGVLRAEALAREVVARLAPWGVPQPARVVWRVGAPRDATPAALAPPMDAAWRAWSAVPRAARLARVPQGSLPDGVWGLVDSQFVAAQQWAACAAVDGGTVLRGEPVRFADLPDPFAPLVALWETGYALDAITAEAVVLVAPEVG
jgi:hypothetical protein